MSSLSCVIFRPYNLHCIHVDQKASKKFRRIIEDLAYCYNWRFQRNNIFIIKRPFAIEWGHISVLQADLACLEELIRQGQNWDYFANFAGTELPLVTYKELLGKIQDAPSNTDFLDSHFVAKKYLHRIQFFFEMRR